MIQICMHINGVCLYPAYKWSGIHVCVCWMYSLQFYLKKLGIVFCLESGNPAYKCTY